MKIFKSVKRDTLVKIVNGVLPLFLLALSVEMFKAWKNQGPLIQISTAFFFSSAVYRFLRAMMNRRSFKMEFIRDIIAGCCLLGGAVLLLVSDDSTSVMARSGIFYFLAILTDRIFSIIKKRTPVNIILNVAVVVGLVLFGHSLISVVLVSIVQAMKEILEIAYSQMKMDIFWKVVRKTNTAEILFGMFLLIIAFSLVLPILEESIPDFFSALWYCFAIISTIGFGDVAAVSVLGRILSAILGLCGLVVVSVVMSIVVNFYNETKDLDE